MPTGIAYGSTVRYVGPVAQFAGQVVTIDDENPDGTFNLRFGRTGLARVAADDLEAVSDHSMQIADARRTAVHRGEPDATDLDLVADLLDLHDRKSISLDNWVSARAFVERHIGEPIQENGA